MQEMQYYPHLTRPVFYRFAIYIRDATEDNAIKVLDLLRSSLFEGTVWSLKLDISTREGRFYSAGDKNITIAKYKVCKYYVQKELKSDNDTKCYMTIEGMYINCYYLLI